MVTDYPSTFEENSCMKMVGLQFCIPWHSSQFFLTSASPNDTVAISMSVEKQILLCGEYESNFIWAGGVNKGYGCGITGRNL